MLFVGCLHFWRLTNAELFARLMATNKCRLLKLGFEVSQRRSFPSNSVPWQLAYVCAKLKRKCCFTSSYENKRSLPLIFTCSSSIFSISYRHWFLIPFLSPATHPNSWRPGQIHIDCALLAFAWQAFTSRNTAFSGLNLKLSSLFNFTRL